jgi:predicted nuclease of predicted toxin-antitoxin system
MRLLLDSCLCAAAVGDLRALKHDVVWVAEWPRDPGDEEILNQANSEKRVLVTLDKDFGELAVVFGNPHQGILRIVNFRASQQGSIIERVIESHGTELEAGAIVTVEPGRIRIRPCDDISEKE